MLEILYDKSLGLPSFTLALDDLNNATLNQIVENHINVHSTINAGIRFYLLNNGKRISEQEALNDFSCGTVHVVPCLAGGKGGFGSMLRAIGAQIEKTTNREACRDLSGRRLRDINEEKRLKKWISEQADREKEAAEKKKKKLKKMCVQPKHEFSDPDYDKARSEMSDKVHDAVEQGFKTVKSPDEPSVSNEASSNKNRKKIKGSLWVDELDELSDSNCSDSEEETPKKKLKTDADEK